jgi:hypothetical protein
LNILSVGDAVHSLEVDFVDGVGHVPGQLGAPGPEKLKTPVAFGDLQLRGKLCETLDCYYVGLKKY